ncbi:E3 ubiquitin-protein ligase DCST1 [Menidia menidia]
MFDLLRPSLLSGARRFLQRPEDFPKAHLALRALFGAASGTVLFLGVAHSLPLTFDLKLTAGVLFVGLCAAGGALSSSFRCLALLAFPGVLGSRGRAYLMILMVSVLYGGPISNIQHNVESAALSLSCNLDLQVLHSRLMWKHAILPFVQVAEELVGDKAAFEWEALSVSGRFQSIRDEVVQQYGYDRFRPPPPGDGNSTQDQFASKTKMQCDTVVSQGVQRCADWFGGRWETCMAAIPVPVINHILCVSMKFHFLCDVMRVMTPWCREQVPVEGNFGLLFDRLNVSVELLSREFSAELVLQEQQQQEVLQGAELQPEFSQALKASFQQLSIAMETVQEALQLLMSLTFSSLFAQAFGYLRRYRGDVCFDNVYVTSDFRRIDAHRRRSGKSFLLPLTKSERNQLIDLWSPRIYPEEFQQVMSGVFQLLSVSLLASVLLTVDFAVFRVLDIVSRHTVTQFNLTSSNQVDIRVDGDSMMARLLRTTISAFNTSSHLDINTNNQGGHSALCWPSGRPPSPLPAGVYVSCVGGLLLLALSSCLQVYSNRLRRAIAAFYHPQREMKRVLFLYNLQLHRRIISSDRKRVANRGQTNETVFQLLSRWGRRLFHRHRPEAWDPMETRYAGS